MIYVVDTHALVWFLTGDSRLSNPAKKVFLDAEAQFVVPTIALAEVKFLFAKGRIAVDLPTVLQSMQGIANLVERDLDERIVTLMPDTLGIHDAIFVATALYYRDVLNEKVNLVTSDRDIAKSELVDVIW